MFNNLKLESVPNVVISDVFKRISDWMQQEGASMNDDYIKRQVEYLKLFIKED